jgi:outer membrane protein W
MKRLLVVLVVVLCAAATVNAQENKWNVGIGGGLAMPMGDAADLTKTGFDAFINATYNFTPMFAAGVEYNYTSLSKDEMPYAWNVNAFLVKGIYTLMEGDFKPYIGLATGLYSSKVDLSGASTNNKFGVAAEVGAKYMNFNVGVAYNVAGKENGSSLTYLHINVGYTFTF